MKILKKFKIVAILLIISFSVISGGEFWHHHNDANFDENQCPVCIIIHSFSGVDVNISSDFIKPVTFEFFSLTEGISKPEPSHTSVLSDRAPPQTL